MSNKNLLFRNDTLKQFEIREPDISPCNSSVKNKSYLAFTEKNT